MSRRALDPAKLEPYHEGIYFETTRLKYNGMVLARIKDDGEVGVFSKSPYTKDQLLDCLAAYMGSKYDLWAVDQWSTGVLRVVHGIKPFYAESGWPRWWLAEMQTHITRMFFDQLNGAA